MGVDQDRQATARERRARIIAELNRGFDITDGTSPASRFRALVDDPDPRVLVANADIDGLISAQMLTSVTGWQVVALIDRQGTVRVHPDYEGAAAVVDTGKAFGVDVFSPLFPNVSNHPVHFGARGGRRDLRSQLDGFDEAMDAAVAAHGTVNLSAWVRISATAGSKHAEGIPYKYPLGSAQVMLALLEVAGVSPRMYDRQYLPWLIANCDGGLDTIRTYAWNAETWWSALAASVGPASLSEAVYQLAATQRPNQAVDIDRRLRYDEAERSQALSTKWNLANLEPSTLAHVVSLISDLSGWPDPFRGGVAHLHSWPATNPTARVLPVSGLSKRSSNELDAHLMSARLALNVNFSVFRERGAALGWMLPDVTPAIEDILRGDTATEEEVAEEPPSVPDAAQLF